MTVVDLLYIYDKLYTNLKKLIMKNLSPQAKISTKSPGTPTANSPQSKTNQKKKKSPLIIIIAIIGLIVIGPWIKGMLTEEPIEKNLKVGEMQYFSFNGKLGNQMVVFEAEEYNVDFSIMTQDGTYAKPANTVTSVLRSHHTGVFIISHNKDTKMKIILD